MCSASLARWWRKRRRLLLPILTEVLALRWRCRELVVLAPLSMLRIVPLVLAVTLAMLLLSATVRWVLLAIEGRRRIRAGILTGLRAAVAWVWLLVLREGCAILAASLATRRVRRWRCGARIATRAGLARR